MKTLSRKHWIVFGIIVLYNTVTIITAPIITGIAVPIVNILLFIVLIHNYLQEPLTEYGIYFGKIYIQIISGIILAFIILFLLYFNNFSWEFCISLINSLKRQFTSQFSLYYIFLILIYATSEEIIFRGFLLTFFQKIFANPLFSVFLSAFLHAVSHYPMNHNFLQVMFSFVLGIIYGYLREKEPEKFTIFTLSLSQSLYKISIKILCKQ